jgi:prepilin-type N-terminal cleavage/methylation domain-containing protein
MSRISPTPNCRQAGPAEAGNSPGFTLIELLVAMAVTGLVLVMVLKLTDVLLSSLNVQNQQMDSVAAARRALDVIATDLQHAKIDNHSSILVPESPGSDLFVLLTDRRGKRGTPDHRFLAVRYSANDRGELVRTHGSVGYGQPEIHQQALDATQVDPGSPLAGYPLASGILGIDVRALGDGYNAYPFGLTSATANWATNSYNGRATPSGYLALVTRTPSFAYGLTNRTRAIEIWFAAVNDQNYEFLKSADKIDAVTAALGPWPPNWRADIDNSPDIPARSKAAIRILTKTIPLP